MANGRKEGLRHIDALLRRLVAPAFRRQGFAESDVVTRWPAIAGPLLADHSVPLKLRFGRDGGTLHVVVDGLFALEMQHMQPAIIERINTYFGYRAVARLALRQAPLPPLAARRRRRPQPDDDAVARAAEAVGTDGPAELNAALTRLGGYVMSTPSRDGGKDAG